MNKNFFWVSSFIVLSFLSENAFGLGFSRNQDSKIYERAADSFKDRVGRLYVDTLSGSQMARGTATLVKTTTDDGEERAFMITAAHCFMPGEQRGCVILEGGEKYYFKEILAHPAYSTSGKKEMHSVDIAVLILDRKKSSPIDFNRLSPLKPFTLEDAGKTQQLTVTGYGARGEVTNRGLKLVPNWWLLPFPQRAAQMSMVLEKRPVPEKKPAIERQKAKEALKVPEIEPFPFELKSKLMKKEYKEQGHSTTTVGQSGCPYLDKNKNVRGIHSCGSLGKGSLYTWFSSRKAFSIGAPISPGFEEWVKRELKKHSDSSLESPPSSPAERSIELSPIETPLPIPVA